VIGIGAAILLVSCCHFITSQHSLIRSLWCVVTLLHATAKNALCFSASSTPQNIFLGLVSPGHLMESFLLYRITQHPKSPPAYFCWRLIQVKYAGQPLHQADRFGDFFPGISPDGTKIAFARVSGLGVEDIYITPIGGGEAKRLTFDNTFTGAWLGLRIAEKWSFLRCAKAIL
jgi:hypothetical protein